MFLRSSRGMLNSKTMVVWVESVFELGWHSHYKLVKHCYKACFSYVSSFFFFLPFFSMGYRNWKSLSEHCQNRLLENLRVLLNECNCLSLEIWVENILSLAHFCCMASDEENTCIVLTKTMIWFRLVFQQLLMLKGNTAVFTLFSLLKVMNKWVFLFFSFF